MIDTLDLDAIERACGAAAKLSSQVQLSRGADLDSATLLSNHAGMCAMWVSALVKRVRELERDLESRKQDAVAVMNVTSSVATGAVVREREACAALCMEEAIKVAYRWEHYERNKAALVANAIAYAIRARK